MPFSHQLNQIQPHAATHDADGNEEGDNNKLLQEEDTGTQEDQEEEEEQQQQQFDSTTCPRLLRPQRWVKRTLRIMLPTCKPKIHGL